MFGTGTPDIASPEFDHNARAECFEKLWVEIAFMKRPAEVVVKNVEATQEQFGHAGTEDELPAPVERRQGNSAVDRIPKAVGLGHADGRLTDGSETVDRESELTGDLDGQMADAHAEADLTGCGNRSLVERVVLGGGR